MFTAWPARRLGRHLQHGIRDVEAAAQVAVAVGPLQRLVAGRPPLLDQPVLQHERAQLRVRRPVVHDLGALGPSGGRAEVRTRARAQRHRLPHVQRLPALVAEDVDARVVRQRREVGPLVGRDRARPARSSARAAATAAGRPRRRRVIAFAHSRGNSAQNTRAHVRASGSARWTSSTSMPSDPASGASPRFRTSGANRRASCTVHSTGGFGQSSPARSNACRSTPHVEARVVREQHAALEQVGDLGQHLVGRRRSVHHALCNAGEALDAARQRALDLDERVVRLVELPAADEHGADLGHLAEVAAVAVRLGVERHELGGGEGCVEVQHGPAIESRGRTDGDAGRMGRSPSTRRS